MKKTFATIRVVKLHYAILTYRQFYKIARSAKKKDGFFADHFFLALEGRLITFLYRASFASNIFDSLSYIKDKVVTLNRKIVDFSNKSTNYFQLLAFHPFIKKRVYRAAVERVMIDRRTLFNPPRYIFISYWFLFAFMVKSPQEDKLVHPIKDFDYYRATGYAL